MRSTLKIFRLITVLIIISVFTHSCKDKKTDPIPYAYVNIFIDPNSTMYSGLNSPGGSVYLTANSPSRGIIVYRFSADEFMAYERTCPYDPAASCARIQVESAMSTAIDSCCMSRFILMDGSPFSGPATVSMKQYRTSYDGKNLHIFN
ncbi:MAG: hypothetical protein NTU44_19515 [Bacteroidetes bacterium]|nr:hypothetical protein [Bacteroidota bacterium]